MNKYLIIVLALFSFNAIASSISIFTGEDNQGVTLSARYENNFIYKFDLTSSKNLSGIGASIGYKFNKINIFAGIESSHGEGLYKAINVSDVYVDAYGTSKGLSNYLEIEYRSFYIRYNKFDLRYKYTGYRDDGLNIISNSVYENRSGNITWIGYRYEF